MSSFKNIHKRKSDMLYICCQNTKFRKELLKHADSELIRCICQCISKVMDQTIPITTFEKKELKKYKRTLRQLNKSKENLAGKKKIIVQSGGGFLLSLIPAVVGALASLIR